MMYHGHGYQCWHKLGLVQQGKFEHEFSQPFESTKISNIFKLEVSFVLASLVAPLSWQVDGIAGQTNILSDPPFHVDHGNAIY